MHRSTIAFPGEGFSSEDFGVAPPPVTVDQWTGASGAWENANNWTGGNAPSPYNVVALDNAASAYTVAYNSTQGVWALKSGTATTLDVQSGWLTAKYGGTVDGALNLNAGATLAVYHGYTLHIRNGTLSGTLAGGEISLFGGGHTISTTDVLLDVLEIASGGTGISANVACWGSFLLRAGADLGLSSGSIINLRGAASLNGHIAGSGTVNVIGSATAGSHLTFSNATLNVSGTFAGFQGTFLLNTINDTAAIYQTGNVFLDGTLNISANAIYDVKSAYGGIGPFGNRSSAINNSGTFINNSDTGYFDCQSIFTNNGTIVAASGTLFFHRQVMGTGNEIIASGATLEIGLVSYFSQSVTFGGANATLSLNDNGSNVGSFDSMIYQFGKAAGESINLLAFDPGTIPTFASASDGIFVNIAGGDSDNVSLHFVGNYSQSGFHISTGTKGEVLTYSG